METTIHIWNENTALAGRDATDKARAALGKVTS